MSAQHGTKSPFSAAAEEGTLAHRVFETGALSMANSDEMAAHIAACLSTISQIPGARHKEIRLEIWREIGLTSPLIFGTADLVIAGEELWLIDLKYGKHPVEPANNPQLYCYALGLISFYGEVYDGINIGILQPRAGESILKTHFVDWETLETFKSSLCSYFANPSDVLNAGDHCYFCPNKEICPERFKDLFPDLEEES